MPAMKQASRGFSVIELMVVVTILGLLLGLAVPTFRQFTRNNSVTSAQNDLVTSLNLARSEALRRNRPVSVCASEDGLTCGDDTEWADGWIAFTDRGTAGTLDGDDVVLQTWQGQSADLVFFSDGDTFVQYLPTGMSAAAVTIDVSWTDCTGGPHKRRVDVMATGAVAGQIVDCAA